jgi:hypothetical protein
MEVIGKHGKKKPKNPLIHFFLLSVPCFDYYRYASLADSTLLVSNNVIGHAVALINYNSINQGNNATIAYNSIITDVNGVTILSSKDTLTYHTSSSWNDNGFILFKSDLKLNSSLSALVAANVNATLSYANNKYTVSVKEWDRTTSGQDSIYAYGFGQYSGSWDQWYATLENSYLYRNNSLFGSAQGDIIGMTPKSFKLGHLNYQTTATDSLYDKVFATAGSTQWYSNTSWSQQGYIQADSKVYVKELIDWNASALMEYGNNEYLFNITETGVTTKQNDYNGTTYLSYIPNDFTTLFLGGYGSSGVTQG